MCALAYFGNPLYPTVPCVDAITSKPLNLAPDPTSASEVDALLASLTVLKQVNGPATDDGQDPTPTIAKAIMDSSMDGIVVADKRGIIRSLNLAAQHLFGYPETEAVGEPIGLLMPEPHRFQHSRYIERYLETGDLNTLVAEVVEPK